MDLRTVKRALRGDLPAAPIAGATDFRWSVISSAEDLYVQPNDELVGVLLAAAQEARQVDLTDVANRCAPHEAKWVHLWPGEHYRLLTALVRVTRPQLVVEIGTFKGQGALALAAGGAEVITYDITPWGDFEDSALRPEDFVAGRIEQRIGDLGDPDYLDEQEATLRRADLVFIDGPKDGEWEQHACGQILGRLTDRQRLIVFDDIRLLEMVQLWRDLPFPKLDATSLGHWSGTGLLHTSAGPILP